MKKILFILAAAVILISFMAAPKQEYYEIKIYHVKTDAQEKTLDSYLKNAYLPALHKAGIKNIGIFKPVELDTADRKIYVLTPFKSLDEASSITSTLQKDNSYLQAGKEYAEAKYDSPPYARMESILLKAFSHHPVLEVPALKSPREERVYELRSYESHTEKIFQNKVHMFNEGGEVALFKRLGFNAVFYGEVIAGPRMPNLMYMTTFENKASRDAHWKTFVDDPEWKKMSSLPQYQNNVSKIDIHFLRPVEYSDY